MIHKWTLQSAMSSQLRLSGLPESRIQIVLIVFKFTSLIFAIIMTITRDDHRDHHNHSKA